MSRSSPSVVCAKTQPFSLKAMRHVFSDGNARSSRKRSFLSRRSRRQLESAWRTENHQMGTRSVSVKPSKTIWQFLRFNGSSHVYQTFRRAKEHCMRPSSWHPPVELSCVEQIIIKRIKRATLFVFLRHHRHELFDEAFQEELITLYTASAYGRPPTSPAQLALATVIQAYTGVS